MIPDISTIYGDFVMEMTKRERLLSAIKGKEIDRVPWSPFLTCYWDKRLEH